MRSRSVAAACLLALLAACSEPATAPADRGIAPTRTRQETPEAEEDPLELESTGYYGSGHGDPPPDTTTASTDGSLPVVGAS